MDMDVKDVVQLIIWAVFGIFLTWGIFLSYVGFKSIPNFSTRRLAKTASVVSLLVGILWIILWVSAVAFNLMQILGVL